MHKVSKVEYWEVLVYMQVVQFLHADQIAAVKEVQITRQSKWNRARFSSEGSYSIPIIWAWQLGPNSLLHTGIFPAHQRPWVHLMFQRSLRLFVTVSVKDNDNVLRIPDTVWKPNLLEQFLDPTSHLARIIIVKVSLFLASDLVCCA